LKQQCGRQAAARPGGADALATMPETFLFYPARADDDDLNEHAALAAAYARRAAVRKLEGAPFARGRAPHTEMASSGAHAGRGRPQHLDRQAERRREGSHGP
jgi:hypothetical protein